MKPHRDLNIQKLANNTFMNLNRIITQRKIYKMIRISKA